MEKAKIDYSNSSISVNSIPFHIPIYRNTPQQSISTISINPRTETIVPINLINNYNITEGIIFSTKLHDNLLIPNAIVKVYDQNKSFISIVNTSIEKVTIPIPQLIIEPIPTSAYIYKLASDKVNNCVNNRLNILKQNLRLDHLNDEEKTSISNICNEFNDIFHLPTDLLTRTTAASHEIQTSDNIPIQTKIYRYPQIHKDEVNDQINKMLKQGIIKPSISPWCSPLWVVPKKIDASGERKWRIVIDYRQLNEKTIGDAYPLPNIEDILDQLGHSQYFSTLDLASGFHQIPMHPDFIEKTAFSTPNGHYEFTRMPFGLKNAPARFQRMMNNVLTGLTNNQCFVYLDDVVLYGSNLEDHNRKLKNIFSRMRENNLKLQPDKCEFLKQSCEYLGHLITNNGVEPNPKKIGCIKRVLPPNNQKQIKMFLGLTGYYRKFIKDYSTIAKPLTILLKKDTKFVWDSNQQNAFQTLKEKLINSPILQYPNFKERFILTTDASNVGIGSVLSQLKNNQDLPIAYYSRTLNKSECNYSTTEKELLAIINSVEHFRPYLYGKKFIIYTDHRALQWLFNCKNPSSKLVRWRLRLSEYDYEIKYKPGRINSNADGLSRLLTEHNEQINFTIKNLRTYNDFIEYHYKNEDVNIYEKNNNNIKNIKEPLVFIWSQDLDEVNQFSEYVKQNFDTNKIKPSLNGICKLKNQNQTIYILFPINFHFDKLEYKHLFECLQNVKGYIKNENFVLIPPKKSQNIKTNVLFDMLKFIYDNNEIKILSNIKTCPKNEQEVELILKENHDSKLAGHCGFQKTYKKIKENFYWPTMKSDIKKYVKKCISCQKNKTNFRPTKQKMEITSTADQPFEKIAIDIVGPHPLTESGNRFILTAQDDLTKFSFAEPIPNHEAITVAKTLMKYISYFGIPRSILSDQGTDFMSELIKHLINLLKTKHLISSPYHPQTNGALERSHLTLKDYLKHYIKPDQTDWDEYIQFAMFSYNSSIHSSTNFTPYELLFGHKAYLPTSITQEPKFHYTYDDYIKSLQSKMNISFKIARENLINSKHRSKKYYDKKINPKEFNVNDLVYIYNKQCKPNLSKKLSPNFKGPFKIIKVFPNKNVELQVGNKIKKYHTNLLKHFVSENE